jgi:hypothetical protein
MDALSDVLRAVRLTGAVFFDVQASESWVAETPPGESIVAKIFPGTLAVSAAALFYPPQSDTPIAAEIRFASAASAGRLSCSLDWRKSAGEQWTIALTTAAGQAIELGDGGARLMVDGEVRETQGGGEYASIYCRFADLVARGESEVDMVPLRLVADCLLVGSRHPAEVRSH